MRRVHGFIAFTPDNDPHGEHDFGSFEHAGKTVFWKIDTTRVLTVMLAEEF